MIGAISGSSYASYPINRARANTSSVTGTSMQTARHTDQPVTPVSPVRSADRVAQNAGSNGLYPIRLGVDPAEMAVRMRIQYVDDPNRAQQEDALSPNLDNAKLGIDDLRKTIEDSECKTCENRKYQDGSDDPGVSFKTATRLSPDQAASAVRGHEMEHVTREQSKAKQEDRKVINQSVTIHNNICPECGDVYVSGGTTRTTTAADVDTQKQMMQQQENTTKPRTPFFAVA